MTVITLLLLALAANMAGTAQRYAADRPIGQSPQERPAYLKQAGIQQHLNQQLPLQSGFTDEDGLSSPLNHWIGKRPLVLVLAYYKCMMMCPQVLHDLAAGLHDTSLIPGKDYDVVTVSINPADLPIDAFRKKAEFLRTLDLPDEGHAVHFLTGSATSIEAISSATGFGYVRVPGPDGKLDQFAHSSVIMFVTANGRLSKYLSGINYSARDLRLSLLDASQHRISNPVDLFLIYCCSYSPSVGKYSVAILRVVSTAGIVTLLGITGLLAILARRKVAV